MAKAAGTATSSVLEVLLCGSVLTVVFLATAAGTFSEIAPNATCLIVGICGFRYLQLSFREKN